MDLYTTPPSLNFSHPCHFCGADTHVVDGQRQPHRCRVDLDAQRAGKSCSNPQCSMTCAHNGPCA
jgi:hypothetical protein